MARLAPVLLSTLSILAGCGGSSGGDVNVDAESSYAAASGSAATSLTNAKAVTGLFVKEDPTIDVTKGAPANADAVAAQVMSSTAGCAGRTVTHATGSLQVQVDFGPGCSIGGSLTVAGMVTASLADHDGAIQVSFTFGPLTVNGRSLTGSATATTSNGTSFTFDEDLLESGNHVVFSGTAALDGGGQGITLDGSGTWQRSGEATATALTATGVHHTFAGCYADAGTLTLARMVTGLRGKVVSVSEVVTFDAGTPSTGKVNVSVNGVASSQTLPKYGSCPHA